MALDPDNAMATEIVRILTGTPVDIDMSPLPTEEIEEVEPTIPIETEEPLPEPTQPAETEEPTQTPMPTVTDKPEPTVTETPLHSPTA